MKTSTKNKQDIKLKKLFAKLERLQNFLGHGQKILTCTTSEDYINTTVQNVKDEFLMCQNDPSGVFTFEAACEALETGLLEYWDDYIQPEHKQVYFNIAYSIRSAVAELDTPT